MNLSKEWLDFTKWRRRIFRRHPYALHIVVPGVVLVLVLVVAAQMLYPYHMALPRTKVGGVLIEHLTVTDAIKKLHEHYDDRRLEVKIPNRSPMKVTTVQAGVIPDYLPAVEKAHAYGFDERLIPFSFVYRLLNNDYPLKQNLDKELASEFAKIVQAHCAIAPVDAKLEFKDGQAKLLKASTGQSCDNLAISQALTSMKLEESQLITTVKPQPVPPKRTDEQMQPLLDEATATITAGVTLASTTDQWPISAEQIASWLVVGGSEDKPTLDVNLAAIKAYVESLRGRLYLEPGQSVTQYVDGAVVSTSTGRNGMGLDADATATQLADAILGRTRERKVLAKLTVLPPRQIAGRHYTPTPRGLQALINQWDQENAGTFGIIVIDLTGKGMNAELAADRDFVTASTFKMFVAYAVMHKIENGELGFDTVTDIGFTVRDCIDEMILHSTNPCAISLMNLAGWTWTHNFIKSQFPSTSLDNRNATADGEKHSTVRDEANFMHRVYNGSLLNGSNTAYLLSLFQRQIWRTGIPRGVPGVTVADKVGFYAGYTHDVGIIYAPRGTYILGIMSRGGTNAQFADLSRKVYALMQQN